MLGNSVLQYYYHHGLIGSVEFDNLVNQCGCNNNNNILGDPLRHCDIVNNNHNEHCVHARRNISRLVNNIPINPYNIYQECSSEQQQTSIYNQRVIPRDSDNSIPIGTPVSLDYVRNQLLIEQLNIQFNDLPEVEIGGMEDGNVGASGGASEPSCDNDNYLAVWLNQPTVRQALHINPKARPWASCRSGIGYHRNFGTMTPQVRHIIDSGIQVLIYNGDIDTVCNFLGDQW